MAYNQNQQQNPQGAASPNAPGQDTAPSSAQAGNQNTNSGQVEDIFADTDASSGAQQPDNANSQNFLPNQNQKAQSNTPAAPNTQSALSQGKIQPSRQPAVKGVPQSQVSGNKKAGFPVKKLLFVIFTAGGLCAVAFGAYIVWNSNWAQGQGSFFGEQEKKQEEVKDEVQDEKEQADTQGNNDQQSPDDTASNNEISDPLEGQGEDKNSQQTQEESGQEDALKDSEQKEGEDSGPILEDTTPKDTDQDGLSDAKEMELGTNPRLVDSDSDGLSDWEEVMIFGTDPLNADSDGDGYLDGEEVQNGYDPLGPGKLLNFEAAEEAAEQAE